MILPNKIKLGSRNFDVIYQKNFRKDHGINGQCNIDHQRILIDDSEINHRENQEITLLHECLHLILEQVGEDELGGNEDFVNKVSEKIHELFKQVEGNEEDNKRKPRKVKS